MWYWYELDDLSVLNGGINGAAMFDHASEEGLEERRRGAFGQLSRSSLNG